MSSIDEVVTEEDVMFELTVIIGSKRISRRYSLFEILHSRNARDFHYAHMEMLQEEWKRYKEKQDQGRNEHD
jgi:hypothetical protein